MNFLAHAKLGGTNEEIVAGSVIGEYIKGPNLSHLPKDIETGVRLHRAIDSHVDQHSFYFKVVNSLDQKSKRYARIVLDVYCDHLLIMHWANFSDISFNQFTTHTNHLINKYIDLVPERYSIVLNKLIRENWLASYKDITGIEMALSRIEYRLGRNLNLCQMLQQIMQLDQEMVATHFKAFYHDVTLFATQFVNQNNS